MATKDMHRDDLPRFSDAGEKMESIPESSNHGMDDTWWKNMDNAYRNMFVRDIPVAPQINLSQYLWDNDRMMFQTGS